MNIALPAFVIILGLLPGILFFHGYFSGRFPRQVAGLAGISEIALYVLFAIPIDALSLWVGTNADLFPDFRLIARLLTGVNTEATAQDLATALSYQWAAAARTYLGILSVAFVSGNIVRKLVWTMRLDVHVHLLRMKHEWFYLLQGRLPALPRSVVPYADVLVEHPGETQLYQGIVSGFEISKDGGINQLILRDAYRGKDRGEEFSWKAIPGQRFIIMGSCIRSLNMRYAVIDEPSPMGGWARRRRAGRRLLRRFWFEEP